MICLYSFSLLIGIESGYQILFISLSIIEQKFEHLFVDNAKIETFCLSAKYLGDKKSPKTKKDVFMSDNQTIKERLLFFISSQDLGKSQFENVCGFSHGWLNRIQKTLMPDKLETICLTFPNLNKSWLMTGEGSMLRTDATSDSYEEADAKEDKDVVMIPVLNLDARGGFADNNEVDTPEYITELIPFRSGVAAPGDFVIPMFGDSMYPRYPSGSRLLVRKVECWREYLELGACYVIALTDGRRIVKIVKKGSDSDHYLLVSVNPDFESQEIPTSLISAVYIVKLMIKNETV